LFSEQRYARFDRAMSKMRGNALSAAASVKIKDFQVGTIKFVRSSASSHILGACAVQCGVDGAESEHVYWPKPGNLEHIKLLVGRDYGMILGDTSSSRVLDW
jgi:hypothetical protein